MIKRLLLGAALALGVALGAAAQVGPLPGMAVLPPPLAAAGCGTPAVTNIGTNNTVAGATVTLTNVTVPAGSLVFVVVTEKEIAGISGSISDGVNTYTEIGSNNLNNFATTGRFMTFYAPNASLSSGTITYTKHSSGVSTSISAVYASNILTSSPVDSAVTATATGNSTTPSVTSGTPGQSGELFLAALGSESDTFTQDSGHSWASPPNADGSNMVAGGNQVNSGTGAKTFSPTLAAIHGWAVAIIGFQHC